MHGNAIDRGPSASLLSTSALARLAAAGGETTPLDGRRFRMNFGIEGLDAHAEDGWTGRRVKVGDAIVVPQGHVGRCAITTLDPDRGTRDLDTLGALAGYRREGRFEPLPLGVYGAVAKPGLVRIGDPVVTRRTADMSRSG